MTKKLKEVGPEVVDNKKPDIDKAMAEAKDPDLVGDWEKFTVEGQEFSCRPLPHKWGKIFRHFALPIMGAQFKPFETILSAIIGERLDVEDDAGVVKSIVESEMEMVERLAPAVGTICASQDEASADATDKMKQAAEWGARVEEVLTTSKLREIVAKQVVVEKEIEYLGKSFAARFRSIANLVPEGDDLASQVLASIKSALSSSEKTGKKGATSSKSSGPSMGKP
jgi:hypothetical protein